MPQGEIHGEKRLRAGLQPAASAAPSTSRPLLADMDMAGLCPHTMSLPWAPQTPSQSRWHLGLPLWSFPLKGSILGPPLGAFPSVCSLELLPQNLPLKGSISKLLPQSFPSQIPSWRFLLGASPHRFPLGTSISQLPLRASILELHPPASAPPCRIPGPAASYFPWNP